MSILLAAPSAKAIELVSSPSLTRLTTLGASSSTAPKPFAVRNIYAKPGASKTTDAAVGRMILFGDSYTDLAFSSGYSNWAEQLDKSSLVGSLESYAIAGGKARPEPGPKPLSVQLDNFIATTPTYARTDLTVIYLGFNDVGFNTDLPASTAAFSTQAERLLATGAVKNDRRLFLMNLFDNTRAPGNNPPGTFHDFDPVRGDVITWNRHLESFANGHDRVVVVDLYTAFEKVFADPAKYGLTNVTTPDLESSARTALWRDELHFGGRGHQLISQVFRHYLTRAWDWSNTLDAGATARNQLKKDIDTGLVIRFDQSAPEGAALRLFPIGEAGMAAASSFDEQAQGATPLSDGGLGLDLALSPSTSLGLVYGNYDESIDSGTEMSAGVDAQSLAVYLDHQWAGLSWRTLLTQSQDRYDTRIHSGFAQATGDGDFDGSTTSLSQRVEKRLETGAGLVAPWIELTHSLQQVDGYTQSHPLVSDVTYSGAEVRDTVLGIGVSAISLPMALGPGIGLSLRGGLAYEVDLARDDYEVAIAESSGSRNVETIERPERRTLVLSLGAALAVGDDVALDLGYEVADQSTSAAEQSLHVAMTWRF
jgi:lysophospholipase L1-like esterase